MISRGTALPVVVSFSELAWVGAFFTVVIYLSETDQLREQATSLRESRDVVARELDEVRTELKQLQIAYGESGSRNKLALRLPEVKGELTRVRTDLKQLQDSYDEVRERLKRRIPKELVGLKGEFHRVVFVMDCSGSMQEKQGGRWSQACQVVRTWLEHLDMDECAVITFSTEAQVFRVNERVFFEMQSADGDKNREMLGEYLKGVRPGGWTNTVSALEMAYRLPGVDTIILFTDGEPTDGKTYAFSQEMADQIYEVCRDNPGIPVNAIGLGDYFDENLAQFLLTVAGTTEGTYHGR